MVGFVGNWWEGVVAELWRREMCELGGEEERNEVSPQGSREGA